MNEVEFLKRLDADCPTMSSGARHMLALFILAARRPEGAPMRHRDLAREMNVPKPSLTRISKFLGGKGFIAHRHNGEDGRDAWLSITDKGRALVRKLRGEELQQERAA